MKAKNKYSSRHNSRFFNSKQNKAKKVESSIVIEEAPSPYFTNTTITPQFIVLHCTGYKDPLEVLKQNKVSCHYLIPQQNQITDLLVYEVVKPPLKAWHAGASQWKEFINLNSNALGIEINMPDYAHALENGTLDFLYFQDFQIPQITALKLLLKQIQTTYAIPAENIIGHSDIAPWRNVRGQIVMAKTDPGPTLPWQQLHANGIEKNL